MVPDLVYINFKSFAERERKLFRENEMWDALINIGKT
jgi:hypothetical protein